MELSRAEARPAACSSFGIIGYSTWAEEIRGQIRAAARYLSNVLILGPSGTGKQLIAEAIHAQGQRHNQPFLTADCAGIPPTLFPSQLFGHVKGAFTGAHYAALGCFRAAEGGTLFLDEIGELDAEMQAGLLRVLQQRTVIPFGSYQEIPVDVRVIAATNRDLPAEVAAGRFREDLFYRLNQVNIATVPLADRPEDIEPLIEFLLDRLAAQQGLPRRRVSRAAVTLLRSYEWPGNVRQLENVLAKAAVFSEAEVIGADHFGDLLENILGDKANKASGGRKPPGVLHANLCSPTAASPQPAPIPNAANPETARTPAADATAWHWQLPQAGVRACDIPSLADLECSHIQQTLNYTYFNQTAAAEILGISRKILARKIKLYRIDASRSHAGRPANGDRPK